MKYILLLFLLPCFAQAQDTLSVGVNTIKTDSNLEIRVRVKIAPEWYVQKDPDVKICCYKGSNEPVVKIISQMQEAGYTERMLLVVTIPLPLLAGKRELSGSVVLVACKAGDCLEPDVRRFNIDLKKILNESGL